MKNKKDPKGKKPKNIHVIRDTLSVRHDFNQAERNVITDRLTKAYQTRGELELQLASIKKDFAPKIQVAEAAMAEANGALVSNYEMRTTDVEVTFNRKKGIKIIKRFCPGKPKHLEVISTEDMTPSDFQRLPMEIPKSDKDKPDPDGKKKVKVSKADAKAIADSIQAGQVGAIVAPNPGDGQ